MNIQANRLYTQLAKHNESLCSGVVSADTMWFIEGTRPTTEVLKV
jgi:hypothetical protein